MSLIFCSSIFYCCPSLLPKSLPFSFVFSAGCYLRAVLHYFQCSIHFPLDFYPSLKFNIVFFLSKLWPLQIDSVWSLGDAIDHFALYLGHQVDSPFPPLEHWSISFLIPCSMIGKNICCDCHVTLGCLSTILSGRVQVLPASFMCGSCQ